MNRKLEYLNARREAYLDSSPHLLSVLLDCKIGALKCSPYFKKMKQGMQQRCNTELIFKQITLLQVIKNDQVETLKFLVEECQYSDLVRFANEHGDTLLREACINGAKETIRYLLSQNADVNVTDDNGYFPLYYTIRFGSDQECLAILAKAGANLNQKNYENMTPLHAAAFFKNTTAIKFLEGQSSVEKKILVNGLDYQAILRKSKKGDYDNISTTIEAPKIEKFAELEARFLQALYVTQHKHEKNFEKYLIDRLSLKIEIDSKEEWYFIDSLMICYWDDSNSVIKFLAENFKKQKLTVNNMLNILSRMCSKYISLRLHQSAQGLLDYVLEFIQRFDTDVTDISGQYCVLSAMFNMLQDYDKSILAAQKALNLLSKNVKLESMIRMSLAIAYKHLGEEIKYNQEVEYAFNCDNQNIDVIYEYVTTLVISQQYSKAIDVCLNAPSSERISVLLLEAKYLKGDIDLVNIEIDEEAYTDYDAKTSALYLKVEKHLQLKEYEVAMSLADKSLELVLNNKNIEYDTSLALMYYLNKCLECGFDEKALVQLKKLSKTYSWYFDTNLGLKFLACLIYQANGFMAEFKTTVDQLIKLNLNTNIFVRILLNLSIQFYLNKDLDSCMSYLDLVLKISPNEKTALYYQDLILNVASNKEEISTKNEPQNIEHDNSDDDLEIFDPKKIHQIMQMEKAAHIKYVANQLSQSRVRSEGWAISETAFYTSEQNNVVQINSALYADYYAIIDPNLNLDSALRVKFDNALLSKNICYRKFHHNGIKFIGDTVVELKIHADARLYATTFYQNPNGKRLIIFGAMGDHAKIKEIVRTGKSINIVAVNNKTVTFKDSLSSGVFSNKAEVGNTEASLATFVSQENNQYKQ